MWTLVLAIRPLGEILGFFVENVLCETDPAKLNAVLDELRGRLFTSVLEQLPAENEDAPC